MLYVPIPADVPYNGEAGIVGSRDGLLKAVAAKMASDTAGKLGSLDAHRVLAIGAVGGVAVDIEIRLAWDEPHRSMVTLWAATPRSDKAAHDQADAYFASFEVAAAAASAKVSE
jgi:hypothetical protein